MTPHAWPHGVHAVHRTPIQTRFADTDALGHVNNGSFVIYTETARLAFFRDVGFRAKSLILARVAVDFRRQILIDQTVVVETSVRRIGTTSATLRQDIYADDVLAAETESVVVHFDYATQRPIPWTDDARAAFARHPAPDAADGPAA